MQHLSPFRLALAMPGVNSNVLFCTNDPADSFCRARQACVAAALCCLLLSMPLRAEICDQEVGRLVFGPTTAIAILDDHAFVGRGALISVFDVTSDSRDSVADVSLPGIVIDLKVRDDTLYALTNKGLHLLDVDDPTSPLRSTEVLLELDPSLVGIDYTSSRGLLLVAEDHAVVVATQASGGFGFWVIDLVLPNPSVVFQTQTFSFGPGPAAHSGDGALFHGGSGFVWVDLSEPATPVFVNVPDTAETDFVANSGVEDIEHLGGRQFAVLNRGDFAAVGVELVAMDFSQPLTPVIDWRWELAGADAFVGANDIEAQGDRLYVAASDLFNVERPPSIVVLDISDRTDPSEFATFRLDEYDAACGLAGARCEAKFFRLAVSDSWAAMLGTLKHTEGIMVVDGAAPSLATGARFIPVRNDVSGVASVLTEGNLLFVNSGSFSTRLYDISNARRPVLLPFGANGLDGEVVAVDGSTVYTKRALPFSPPELNSFEMQPSGGFAFLGQLSNNFRGSFEVVGTRGFSSGQQISTGQVGVEVFDLSDPSNVTNLGTIVVAASAIHQIAVVGNTLFVAHSEGLLGVDISNPASPIETPLFDDPANGLVADGDQLFVVRQVDQSTAVLETWDVQDPAVPQKLAESDFSLSLLAGLGTEFLDKKVLLHREVKAIYASVPAGLRVIGFENPLQLEDLGLIETAVWPGRIASERDHLYAPLGPAGVKILACPRVTTSCAADPSVLCLGDDRFSVQVDWLSPAGQQGVGMPVQLTSDTGYFWFFNESNVEMVIKVLDACSFNDRFWVYAGGLTDVEVSMTVSDLLTGEVASYSNPQGTPFRPIQDTDALATCFAESPVTGGEGPIGQRAEIQPAEIQPAEMGSGSILSLGVGGRFEVMVDWSTPGGQQGVGMPVQLTSDTGYFWFFNESNVEVVIKVLDACSFNSRFWVYAGGLTDVDVSMTVTDTQTGVFNTYRNPQGTPFQPIQSTDAFDTCP